MINFCMGGVWKCFNGYSLFVVSLICRFSWWIGVMDVYMFSYESG